MDSDHAPYEAAAAAAGHDLPCPGPCNRDWRHALDDGRLARNLKAPVPGMPTWCRDCADLVARALRGLRHMYELLVAGAPLAPVATAERHGSGHAAPSPSPALDQADEILQTLATIERYLRAHLGHATAGHDGLGFDGYLLAHITALLCSPRAAEAGTRILRLHRATQRRIGMDRFVARLDAPCPACDLRGLARDDGSEMIQCRCCNACWSWEDYERLCHILAEDLTAERQTVRR